MREREQGPVGYMHADYARSLAEFGIPRQLHHCRGWILERQIPGFQHHDGMGCYPLFACQHWDRLEADIERLGSDLVSVSLVTDPFGTYELSDLSRCFKDICRPFKEHFVTDLNRSPEEFVSNHHRRNARKALAVLEVERCAEPLAFLDDWTRLYSHLVQRHSVSGIAAFSEAAFAVQLQVPGLVAFRAVAHSETVGMILWYVQGEVAYYHLGGYSPRGYKLGASFALFWHALGHFAAMGLSWLSLGGGAGVTRNATDGLSRFKRGWSTDSRIAYFCGRIFDRAAYAGIVRAHQVGETDHFPAYRAGEFGQ